MKIKTGKIKKQDKTVKGMTLSAGIALKNGFYTETIWILSDIIEERLIKVIMITERIKTVAASGIEKKLKRVKLLLSQEHNAPLKEHFPYTLITSIRSWKNKRNILMKDMLEMRVSLERKERLVKQGIGVLKELDKVYKHYKLAAYVQPKHEDFLPEIQVSEQPVIIETIAPQASNLIIS